MGLINTIDFPQKVFRRAPFVIKKIYTDQDREFIANNVKAFLNHNDIVYRNNTSFYPEENGKIERFHQTLIPRHYVVVFLPETHLKLCNTNSISFPATTTILESIVDWYEWNNSISKTRAMCKCKLDAAIPHFLTKSFFTVITNQSKLVIVC